MSDWQVGDLAVCVGGTCRDCERGQDRMGIGTISRVTGVEVRFYWSCPGLRLDGHPSVHDEIWCSCSYRKIRPDELTECEEEFRILLNLSKKRVTAETIVTVDRDGRAWMGEVA